MIKRAIEVVGERKGEVLAIRSIWVSEIKLFERRRKEVHGLVEICAELKKSKTKREVVNRFVEARPKRDRNKGGRKMVNRLVEF